MEEQLFWAMFYFFGALIIGLAWMWWYGQRMLTQERKSKEHDSRLRVIEMWPNQNDRLEDHEKRLAYLEREMQALHTNAFTGETLRRVK